MTKPKSRIRKEKYPPQVRSQAWLQAIEEAGAVAATANSLGELQAPLQTLQALRGYLEKRQQHWYRVPKVMPSKIIATASLSKNSVPEGDYYGTNNSNGNHYGSNSGEFPMLLSGIPSASQQVAVVSNQNRYAAFQDDDDDEEEEDDDDEEESESEEEEQHALEHPNHSNNNYGVDSDDGTVMSMRRLLVRVLTTLSELTAKGTNLRRRQQKRDVRWKEGASDYAMAFEFLSRALQIADEEYARLCLQQEESSLLVSGGKESLSMEQLADDAQVVMIAIGSFTEERDKYVQAAERRRDYLQHKLEPQWESRDEVKARIGIERWENNPRPKNDYAQQRRADEAELRAIEQTQEQLQSLDAAGAMERSQMIYNHASSNNTSATGITSHYKASRNGNRSVPDAMGSSNDQHVEYQNRYNGVRPDYGGARVSWEVYPDPTVFGWTFTGSAAESFVEFFEKQVGDKNNPQLVKLDWYFTTGTVKTSMDHPTRGKNQLFGKQVTPELYQEVLLNPRAHTGQRYRHNNTKNKRGGGGRGGGRGGAGGGRRRGGRRSGGGRNNQGS